jgi:hypothetical protein
VSALRALSLVSSLRWNLSLSLSGDRMVLIEIGAASAKVLRLARVFPGGLTFIFPISINWSY